MTLPILRQALANLFTTCPRIKAGNPCHRNSPGYQFVCNECGRKGSDTTGNKYDMVEA
jgi:transposase-like protein